MSTYRNGLRDRLARLRAKPWAPALVGALVGAALGLLAGYVGLPAGNPVAAALHPVFTALLGAAVAARVRARTRRRERRGGASAFIRTPVHDPAPGSHTYDALLLTRSCTTGWLDWVHGELWLLPGALVRLRTSLAETNANSLGPTVVVPERVDPGAPWFSPHEVQSASRRNKYLALDDIAEARLRTGRINGRLDLTMRDGTRHLLLWLAVDPAYWVLLEELPLRIPGRFVVT